jgi:hypothetical protein
MSPTSKRSWRSATRRAAGTGVRNLGKHWIRAALLTLLALPRPAPAAPGVGEPLPGPDWLRNTRLAAEPFWVGMRQAEIEAVLQLLAASGVNTVDADLSGDLVSVAEGSWALQPETLATLRLICDTAHGSFPGMRVFAYLAPLEYGSPNVDMDRNGEVDPGLVSMYTLHPEWAQQGIDGAPALFYGSVAFWVGPNDEDLWLCPNDPVYRQRTAELLTAVTACGVDGIYLDVPFLIHEFGDDWEHQWPCHCTDCGARFLADTGLPLPALADYADPAWRRFIDWRLQVMQDWIGFCRETVIVENPQVALIIEHWNGLDDGYSKGDTPTIYPQVSQVRAHEWGDASAAHYFTWLAATGYHLTYRGIDQSQPSWILAYADHGDAPASRLLAASVIGSGCCFWETDAPDMAGSVDYGNRRAIFNWLAPRDRHYYAADLEPYADVALLYSPRTIAFLDGRDEAEYGSMEGASFAEYMGVLMMLLESHLPFRVITESDLTRLVPWESSQAAADAIRARALMLPRSGCLDNEELQAIRDYAAAGGAVVATWETSLYNAQGISRGDYGLADLFGVHYPHEGVAVNDFGAGRAVFTALDPGIAYYWAAAPNARRAANPAEAELARQYFLRQVWQRAQVASVLRTDAPRRVLLLPTLREGELALSLLNYVGVDGGDPLPSPQWGIAIDLEKPRGLGAAVGSRQLPFLGADQPLPLSNRGATWGFSCDVALHTLATIQLPTRGQAETAPLDPDRRRAANSKRR